MKPWYCLFWEFLHTVPLFSRNPGAQPLTKEDAHTLLKALSVGIPCSQCKNDYANLISEIKWDEINLSNEDWFFNVTVEIHNTINKKLQKPTLTLDEAKVVWY